MPEFMDIWAKIHGVKIAYDQISYEEFFEGLPPVVLEELGDSFKYIEEFGQSGGDPSVLRPGQVRIDPFSSGHLDEQPLMMDSLRRS